MGAGKGRAHFLDLPPRLGSAEIDRRPDADGAHVERLIDAGEQGLIVLHRQAQDLVVVELHDERNLVGVAARHHRQHPVGRGHRVTTALQRQFTDRLRVEELRIGRERGRSRVLDALIDRQNRQIARAPKRP